MGGFPGVSQPVVGFRQFVAEFGQKFFFRRKFSNGDRTLRESRRFLRVLSYGKRFPQASGCSRRRCGVCKARRVFFQLEAVFFGKFVIAFFKKNLRVQIQTRHIQFVDFRDPDVESPGQILLHRFVAPFAQPVQQSPAQPDVSSCSSKLFCRISRKSPQRRKRLLLRIPIRNSGERPRRRDPNRCPPPVPFHKKGA